MDRIRELDRMGRPIGEILEAIDSPKAREVLEEYQQFLRNKSGSSVCVMQWTGVIRDGTLI
ncbi:MAG: hypothetical protein GPJ27_13705 [Microcystis aeruginosa L111-01]|nr:hypothetical protein [Microcystis aeruginosa L111-01]